MPLQTDFRYQGYWDNNTRFSMRLCNLKLRLVIILHSPLCLNFDLHTLSSASTFQPIHFVFSQQFPIWQHRHQYMHGGNKMLNVVSNCIRVNTTAACIVKQKLAQEHHLYKSVCRNSKRGNKIIFVTDVYEVVLSYYNRLHSKMGTRTDSCDVGLLRKGFCQQRYKFVYYALYFNLYPGYTLVHQ